MKTVLLTGFERFGAYDCNPTEDLVCSLDKTELGGWHIQSMVLPIDIFPHRIGTDYGDSIVQHAIAHDVGAIVSFGLASDIQGFRMEKRAKNWIYNEKYCDPEDNHRVIDSRYPKRGKIEVPVTRINVPHMHKEFSERSVPFEEEISQNANTYCCNAIMFLTLQALKAHRSAIPYFFFHIPCTAASVKSVVDFDPKKKLISQEKLVSGTQIILDSIN